MLIVVGGGVYLLLTGLALWEIAHAQNINDLHDETGGDDDVAL